MSDRRYSKNDIDSLDIHFKAAASGAFPISPDSMQEARNVIAQLQARVGELEAQLRSAVKIADEAAEEWDKAPAGMRAGKILLALCGRVPGYRADTDAIHAALRSADDGGEG